MLDIRCKISSRLSESERERSLQRRIYWASRPSDMQQRRRCKNRAIIRVWDGNRSGELFREHAQSPSEQPRDIMHMI
ncbi:hypothetical protein AR158_c657L [Paramecium bursaria Chlorella virus AR158]|uniref:hypothetical protein n=1 Tax=Paramecium bursaria Chlorella virus AR158 TaxID=380598 RepID=UPI00015AA80C|nr:hypothetical protein AR158_c657L [Paramecium bursaria Chlorella virus AR158]ABU44202.1 hypothetical protein AR158_c657L [Paramecium bursaria Chlorella virus AR158]